MGHYRYTAIATKKKQKEKKNKNETPKSDSKTEAVLCAICTVPSRGADE